MVDKIETDKYFAANFFVLSHTLTDRRQQTIVSACHGFTLVELIMVVAVLGVLSAMAIPSFTAYVKTAKVAACATDLRTIEKSVTSYIIENNALPANLNVAGMGNIGSLKDPWERAYMYQDLSLAGDPPLEYNVGADNLNIDYDLYSKGEDGASTPANGGIGNDDDIVRANDGAFVGVRP